MLYQYKLFYLFYISKHKYYDLKCFLYFVYKNNSDGSNKYEAEILKKLNLDK